MLGPKPKQQMKKENSEKGSQLKNSDIQSAPHSFYIIKEPHITEKSSTAGELNQYSFKVGTRVNKILVKQEIEHIYKVQVEKVRIINVHRKKRQLGRTQGHKTGYKKAIVTLKKGHKIEILPK